MMPESVFQSDPFTGGVRQRRLSPDILTTGGYIEKNGMKNC